MKGFCNLFFVRTKASGFVSKFGIARMTTTKSMDIMVKHWSKLVLLAHSPSAPRQLRHHLMQLQFPSSLVQGKPHHQHRLCPRPIFLQILTAVLQGRPHPSSLAPGKKLSSAHQPLRQKKMPPKRPPTRPHPSSLAQDCLSLLNLQGPNQPRPSSVVQKSLSLHL